MCNQLFLKAYFQFLQYYWWFLRVTLVVAFGLLPQNLGGGGDLQMVLCHSKSVGSTVGIP